jgi:hypothetical protein
VIFKIVGTWKNSTDVVRGTCWDLHMATAAAATYLQSGCDNVTITKDESE